MYGGLFGGGGYTIYSLTAGCWRVHALYRPSQMDVGFYACVWHEARADLGCRINGCFIVMRRVAQDVGRG